MRQQYEVRSISLALQTYLESKGWTGLTYKENFQHEDTIVPGLVDIHFLPSRNKDMQMGNSTEKFIDRVVQVDAYMESENRAAAILDDVMDFMDLAAVTIRNENNGVLGEMFVSDKQTIIGQVFNPVYANVKILWWRAASHGTFLAHYYDPAQ